MSDVDGDLEGYDGPRTLQELPSCPRCGRQKGQPQNCAHSYHDLGVDLGLEQGKELQRWADPAMYTAEPIDSNSGPKVTVLHMTADPLGAIAAFSGIYSGKVYRAYSEVSDKERRQALEDMTRTALQAPLETVDIHFLIEGIDRSITHQMVRQRTAVYAQESLRFAVKEELPTSRPPSLSGTDHYSESRTMLRTETYGRLSKAQQQRILWDATLENMHSAYAELVAAGMPAEEARGLLPHCTLTRIHYKTNLRNFLVEAGKRLCTQAQFDWRLVFAQMADAIRYYGSSQVYQVLRHPVVSDDPEVNSKFKKVNFTESAAWQYEAIAGLLRPVCYLTGKCEFMARADRHCKIRNRVEANASIGRRPAEWETELDAVVGNPVVVGVGPHSVVRDVEGTPVFIGAIQPAEWLLDPGAAR